MFRLICLNLLILFCLFYSSNIYASTINASSCSQSDVANAISSASEGDTVVIPSGTCTWTSRVNLTKGIILTGNGVTNTIIRNGVPHTLNPGGGGTADAECLRINTSDNTYPQIKNIQFQDDGNTDAYSYNGDVYVYNAPNGFRIHHCKFDDDINSRAIYVVSKYWGLIDNNTFSGAYIRADGSLSSSEIDGIWTTETNFGDSSDTLFVEDNTFTNDDTQLHPVCDGERGIKVTIRYNEITNTDHIMHGNESSRGTLRAEIYGNIFTLTNANSNSYNAITLRGGTGVIFDNSFDDTGSGSSYTNLIQFKEYCACAAVSLGDCSDNCFDESITSYPFQDQVGRTYNQNLEPIPIFSNTYNGSSVSSSDIDFYEWSSCSETCSNWDGSTVFQEDRDYYVEKATFDGTSGVGVGSYSSMPATCTTGVMYWAIDKGGNWNLNNASNNDGALYKCTATDTWTLYYTPYTYPHPLRGEGRIMHGVTISGGVTIQ